MKNVHSNNKNLSKANLLFHGTLIYRLSQTNNILEKSPQNHDLCSLISITVISSHQGKDEIVSQTAKTAPSFYRN